MVDTVQTYVEEAQTAVFSGTQQLASLASNEYCDYSDEIDNSAVSAPFADFLLELGSITTTAATVALYIIPSVDGTTYPDWVGDGTTGAEEENEPHFAGTFSVSIGLGAKVAAIRNVSIPPGKFRLAVRNVTGVAFAATANSLKYRRWTFSSQ